MSKSNKEIEMQDQLEIDVKISRDAKKVTIVIRGDQPITVDDIEGVLIHVIEMSGGMEEKLDRH